MSYNIHSWRTLWGACVKFKLVLSIILKIDVDKNWQLYIAVNPDPFTDLNEIQYLASLNISPFLYKIFFQFIKYLHKL